MDFHNLKKSNFDGGKFLKIWSSINLPWGHARAVLTFIGYKQTEKQTDRQVKFIYRLFYIVRFANYYILAWEPRFNWNLYFPYMSQPTQLRVFKPRLKHSCDSTKSKENHFSGSWDLIGHTNKNRQTNKDYYFIYKNNGLYNHVRFVNLNFLILYIIYV